MTRPGSALFWACALGLVLAACGSGAQIGLPSSGKAIRAAPQRHALLAVVRSRFGNPAKVAIVTLGPNAGNRTTLPGRAKVKGVSFLRVDTPAWSPDGREIYFTGATAERRGLHYFYDQTDVFAMRSDGSRLRRLTKTQDASSPLVSPDGATVAFARTVQPGAFPPTLALWAMRTDGTRPRRLVEPRKGYWDTPGAWAPDGRTFLFSRCRFALPGQNGLIRQLCAIYALSASRVSLRLLEDRAQSPSFSPDGTQIAFVSDRARNGTLQSGEDEIRYANELYVMDADGEHVRRLTRTKELDEQAPSWSPDGAWIAYARQGPSIFVAQVMRVRADGSCPTRIVGNAERDTALTFEGPHWRPGEILDRKSLRCRSV